MSLRSLSGSGTFNLSVFRREPWSLAAKRAGWLGPDAGSGGKCCTLDCLFVFESCLPDDRRAPVSEGRASHAPKRP